MKKQFVSPICSIIELGPADVLTASDWSVTTDEEGGIELPPIPIP